jgi:hypothetical protein
MKTALLSTAALCLLTLTASAGSSYVDSSSGAASPLDDARLIPVAQFAISGELDVAGLDTSIVYDRHWVYLSLPSVVLRGQSPLGSSAMQTVFQPPARSINRLYAYDHVLYVLTRPRLDTPDHTLYRSANGGTSFVPIDAGLWDCSVGCFYMESTELFVRDGLLYVNAGGGKNLLVSEDRGASYQALSGEPRPMACYHGAFDIIGRTALLGGECGLDMAYIDRGVLSENGLTVVSAFQPVKSPSLSNRKVSVIAHEPGTPLVLAGAEGALLRSVNEGQSFEYAFQYHTADGFYPYIGNILFPKQRRDLILIGGFDKADFKPYLAYGSRDARKWTDISHLLAATVNGAVTGLTEDPEGRLLVTVADQTHHTVSVLALKIGE